MSRLPSLINATRLLAIASFALTAMAANADKPTDPLDKTIPPVKSLMHGVDIGPSHRCPNTFDCLVTTDWARIEKLNVGPKGIWVKSPLTLCDPDGCNSAMLWEFDDRKLFLRASREGNIHENPVIMIEQKMADTTRVGIGVPPDHDIKHELEVNGTILAEEIIVETGWADHVLDDDYPLMPLSEVAQYIGQQGHLPGIPAADEVVGRGVKLGEMQVSLLEKIEEITLHLIAQEKEIQRLRDRIMELEVGT